MADFTANLAPGYKQALASAAGVDASWVSIVSVAPVPAGPARRLQQSAASGSLFVTSFVASSDPPSSQAALSNSVSDGSLAGALMRQLGLTLGSVEYAEVGTAHTAGGTISVSVLLRC